MKSKTLYIAAVAGLLAVGANTTVGAGYMSTVLADNPAGYWRLDTVPPVTYSYATNSGLYADALNGVINDFVREGAAGAIAGDTNKAMQFIGNSTANGNASTITVPYQSALNQGNSFTFECWMNPNCPYGNAQALVTSRNGENGFTVYINGDGSFGFNMDRGASGGYWSSCTVTNASYTVVSNLLGKWTHVACVYDATAGTSGYGVEYVYFNAVLMATNEIVNAPWVPNSGGPMIIGDRNYSGLLDEVGFWGNLALTPAQLLAHYQAGTNGLGQYKTVVLADNPDCYWRLGETGGVTAPIPNIAVNGGTVGALYNGTYDIGMTLQQPGAIVASTNTSVHCDGLHLFYAPAGAALNPQAPFSVELWTKPDIAYASGGTGQSTPLSSVDVDFGRSGWFILQGQNGFSFWLGTNTTSTYQLQLDPTYPVYTTNWYHIVGTYDGHTATLYINGTQVGSAAMAAGNGFSPNFSRPLTIGGRTDVSRMYQGYVANVAVYNTLLSPADALSHYQNGTNKAPAQTYDSLVAAKSPLAYWRLNEEDTTVYPPRVTNLGWLGHAVDGTVVGNVALTTDTPWWAIPTSPRISAVADGLLSRMRLI